MKPVNLIFSALALFGLILSLEVSGRACSCKCPDGARLLEEFKFFSYGLSFVEITLLVILLLWKGIRSYLLLGLIFATPYLLADYLNSKSPGHGHLFFTRAPNQALEPTTTAVTNRASARFAPAAVVAHL